MIGSQEGFKLQEEIAKCLLVGLGYPWATCTARASSSTEQVFVKFIGNAEDDHADDAADHDDDGDNRNDDEHKEDGIEHDQ